MAGMVVEAKANETIYVVAIGSGKRHPDLPDGITFAQKGRFQIDVPTAYEIRRD